jgi:CheY-like chemotaxis protein
VVELFMSDASPRCGGRARRREERAVDEEPGHPGGEAVRVAVVDDHEIVRRGVRDLIESAPGLVFAGEASGAAEALRLVPALRPRVAILDVRLPDGDGVSLCRELRSRMPAGLPDADLLQR